MIGRRENGVAKETMTERAADTIVILGGRGGPVSECVSGGGQ